MKLRNQEKIIEFLGNYETILHFSETILFILCLLLTIIFSGMHRFFFFPSLIQVKFVFFHMTPTLVILGDCMRRCRPLYRGVYDYVGDWTTRVVYFNPPYLVRGVDTSLFCTTMILLLSVIKGTAKSVIKIRLLFISILSYFSSHHSL